MDDVNVEIRQPQTSTDNSPSKETPSSPRADSEDSNVPSTSHRVPQPYSHHMASTPTVRRRGTRGTSFEDTFDQSDDDFATQMGYEFIQKPENALEAHRIANNYMFGFKKWKSHLSKRPLELRSSVVQDLYQDTVIAPPTVKTCNCGNVLYVILFGWIVSLMYAVVGTLMYMTFIGRKHGSMCLTLAKYFIWPFGKFVHKNLTLQQMIVDHSADTPSDDETTPLRPSPNSSNHNSYNGTGLLPQMSQYSDTKYWKQPGTYIWLLLGIPLLFIIHVVLFVLSWATVVYIPVAKLHLHAITRGLLLPPELLRIDSSSYNADKPSSNIIMYIPKALNLYYYKYTVDGVNVICVNLLGLVAFSLLAGYIDTEHKLFSRELIFSVSLLSIIPLAYYIGMGITSVSAQTNFAVGAVLNASFGSIVEIILYMAALVEGHRKQSHCYEYLVKSGLVGTLLATALLIPGLSMVIGGIKHSTQRFNRKSAGISATLLFVAIAGTFAPSIFARAYGVLSCNQCVNATKIVEIGDNATNLTWGLECAQCNYNLFGPGRDMEYYNKHIAPLIYTCMIVLPIAYIIGLVYSLKTHKGHVYDTFQSDGEHADHGAHWGIIKSCIILLITITLMSLCADLVTKNVEPLLNNSGISVYFFGATLFALAPDIPEIVIGIQFALQNNISLSIEVGSCIAVQVCMVQIPILVLANVIYPVGWYLIFDDIHIWSVAIGILMMNYVFQDGKSDYFQGFCLVAAYITLVAMFFFAPNPTDLVC